MTNATTTDVLALLGATKAGGGTNDTAAIAAINATLAAQQAQITTLAGQVQENNNPPPVTPNLSNFHAGKNHLFLGTSILEGSTSVNYPKIACTALAANCNNQALGTSSARVAHWDGSIDNMPYTTFLRSLMKTIAECNYIGANWANSTGTPIGTAPTSWTASLPLPIRAQLGNAGGTVPASLNDIRSGSVTYLQDMIAASYENRVLPYLPKVQTNSIGQTVGNGFNNGTLVGSVAQFIGIEHFYNGYQAGRNSTNPAHDDINAAKKFNEMPAIRNDRFTEIGAVNMLIDFIMDANPQSRIYFIGHYENQANAPVSQAQQVVSTYWEFQICKMWEKTGWSTQLNPATGITIKNSYLTTDNLHPVEPVSVNLLANFLYQFLQFSIF